MGEPKGDKLVVNLSASQTRRRLRGFGHGVKKIQSAGRNRAVIIHTATGRHREELEARFADVGCAGMASELSEPIGNLRNLGPTSAQWLRDVGIQTVEDLQRLGPAQAYRLVERRRPRISLNLLWAMAAGLEHRDWRELRDEEKQRLRAQIRDE